MAINEKTTGDNSIAITGTASNGQNTVGVKGIGDSSGVRGEGKTWHGVAGISNSSIGGFGVFGQNTAGGTGVCGESTDWMGVYGHSGGTKGGAGVMGEGELGPGVIGKSAKWVGVYGETAGIENGPAGVWGEHKGAGIGVKAVSQDGLGLAAFSTSDEAIHAETTSPGKAAIAGFNLNPNGTGAAVYGEKLGTIGHAGFFQGNVHITGNLTADGDIFLPNADCAEDFDVSGADRVEPGTVMVLGNEGALSESHQAYDKRVAGVISGAGDYKPGIVLDKRQTSGNRQPVALMGKVFCKVDAQFGAIEIGDLLTTSPTPGHAMKTSDPLKAFGAVIGKALRPLTDGQGLIPILIALQ